MRINEFAESQQSCPECGGPAFSNLLLAEKQDACYNKVKSRYKVWPSAYASGALVQCRKKGAANWGNKSESVAEGEVVQFPKKHKGDLSDTHDCPKCGGDLQGGKYMGHEVKVCMPCKQVYLPPNSGIDQQGNKIDEYGDTAKGQKMLTKVQKRATDRMIKADDKRDKVAAKKNSDTAYRAWDRMTDKDLEEAYGPWGKKTPQDIERIRKHQEREKKNTTPGQLRKSEPAITKRNSEKAMSYFASLEEYNAEYDDEAGMAQGSLHTLQNAVAGLQDVIDSGDNLPEWCQEKISLAEDYLVTVWDYIQSEKAQGIDPEISEEFDMIERIIESIAAQNRVDAEMVWEDLESLSNDELYAFAVTSQLNEDWSKVNKKDKTDGMSQKAVNAYRRENPGSKLKTAVTTKPSKLKKGSKASKRRKSYCSRSKGQMNMHNISCAKTPDKAICKARRRWNC